MQDIVNAPVLTRSADSWPWHRSLAALFLLLILQLPIANCVRAQPTSIGGVTPGKTTIDELRGLVRDEDVGKIGQDENLLVTLRALPDNFVSIDLHEGVVLRTTLPVLDHKDEALIALFAKYGRPTQRTGRLREVTCQNRLGAKFQRLEGTEVHAWPKKDGISASMTYEAGTCASVVLINYVLEKSDLAAKLKRAEQLRELSERVDRVRNLQKGL